MNRNGEAWFVGKDVAEVLGYKDASNAVFNNVVDDDKTTLVIHQSGSSYKTKTTIINESGRREARSCCFLLSFMLRSSVK